VTSKNIFFHVTHEEVSYMREVSQLRSMQAAPLSVKILLTKQRIREWVHQYGEDGVYVSFSGGKDSTVLLDIVRQDYPDVPAVFVDTGLEYPEIREFVKTFDNVIWLKPDKNFRQVIQDYGYPVISKEISERVYYAQKYLEWYKNQDGREPTDYSLKKFLNVPKGERIPDDILVELTQTDGATLRVKQLAGLAKNGKEKSTFNYEKWLFLTAAPFMISNKCCDIMKKRPVHKYAKETGRQPMTAEMADESRLRLQKWLQHGCNGFDLKTPKSTPMAFWTENDVLQYIKENNIKIASVYGDVVEEGQVPGQISIADLGLDEDSPRTYCTTGCKRTGCMFCGFGCHMEKPGEGRFERLKQTHPKVYDYIMRPADKGGLDFKTVIDWINENGGTSIKY
jgi:3'-phosphoadenosine 5'-phosphosulfate sulfotransferase (PAPS reductase)/FAD synthetase